MRKTLLEFLGWYGAAAIIAAYLLNSFSVLDSSSLVYQVLNVTGALGIVLVSRAKRAFQPMVLNIVWTAIGVVAILKIIMRV